MSRMFVPLGKHPIIDPDLLAETSQEDKYLCCLSERDVFIIRAHLFPFSAWPTRLARPKSGKQWELSTELEFLAYQDDIQELDSKIIGGDFMTCLDQGLSEVATAIRYLADKGCCDGGLSGSNGGVVSTYVDGEGMTQPIYGSHEPYTNDGVTPPDGFDTYEDYLLNKCQLANLVFDGWLQTMRGMSAFTVFNATALATLLGLTLAGVIAFPPAAIPIMIGLLITLGSFVAMFAAISDELEANREAIVCDLYRGETVEAMIAVLADAIDLAIATLGTTTGIASLLKQAAMLLVNSDTLSPLMSGVAGANYPGADCAGCIGCHEIFYPPGAGVRGDMTVISQTDTSFEAQGAPYSDRLRWDFGLAINSLGFADCCGEMVSITDITVTAGSIDGSSGASPGYRLYDCAGGYIHNSSTGWPTFPIAAAYVEVVSGTDFTLEVTWEWND